MKRTKIISLLAMAAVMVGCSQDDLVSVENGTCAEDLSARPILGNVELTIGNPSTRMEISGSYNAVYEEGDQVGCALIDQVTPAYMGTSASTQTGWAKVNSNWVSDTWTFAQYAAGEAGANTGKVFTQTVTTSGGSTKNTARSWYTPTEYISTNYPYTLGANGAWTTEANLVEGNYFFYLPYDSKYQNRGRLKAVLPQVQDCTDKVLKETTWHRTEKIKVSSTALEEFYKGTTEGFEGAMSVVAYQFLTDNHDGAKLKPAADLTPLYAYPMITIKNNFNSFVYDGSASNSLAAAKATATILIDSIQIYDATTTGSNLFYTAAINSANVVNKLNSDWDAARLKAGAPTADILDASDKVAEYPKHVLPSTAKTKIAAVNTALAEQKNHVTLKINKELASGASYSFHAILPAANYGKDLTARVYAHIGDQRVIIANATNNPVLNTSGTAIDHYSVASSSFNDFVFRDETNGDMDCELVRGQHFPKPEIREDGTDMKAFAGDMMTIDLTSSTDARTNVVTGATAFVLSETVVASDNGIVSNEDLIDYIQDNLQRGVKLQEVPALKSVARSQWKTYTGTTSSPITAAAGNIAFANNNTVVINAQLIKDLKDQTVVSGNDVMLTLTASNFPIASDVKMVATTDGYRFTTLDSDAVSYDIDYTGVTFGSNAASLVAGINKIASGTGLELKTKSGASNVVVELASGVSAKFTSNSKNISAIYAPAGTTLTVDVACSALVVAGGSINMGANGSLTNSNNTYTGATIENTALREIAGTLTSTTVSATSTIWPTVALAANSKVNKLEIAPDDEIATLTLDQAQINMLNNLSKVNVTLNAKVKSIGSSANVTIDKNKIASIVATQQAGDSGLENVTWKTTTGTAITVTATGVTLTNISAGTNVTIN